MRHLIDILGRVALMVKLSSIIALRSTAESKPDISEKYQGASALIFDNRLTKSFNQPALWSSLFIVK
jgi:hypothetical protein